MFVRVHLRNPEGLVLSFPGRFLIINSISLLNIGLLRLYLHVWVSARVFLRKWFILSVITFLSIELFGIFFHYAFNACGARNDGLSFISDTSDLCLSSLFFSLPDKIISFIHLFKEQVFGIIHFLFCILGFNSTDFCAL